MSTRISVAETIHHTHYTQSQRLYIIHIIHNPRDYTSYTIPENIRHTHHTQSQRLYIIHIIHNPRRDLDVEAFLRPLTNPLTKPPRLHSHCKRIAEAGPSKAKGSRAMRGEAARLGLGLVFLLAIAPAGRHSEL